MISKQQRRINSVATQLSKELHQTLEEIIRSEDGSNQQREALEKLILLTQQLPIYKYRYRNPDDFDDGVNELFTILCGIDRKAKTINGKTIRGFVEKREQATNKSLSEIDPQWLIKEYRQWVNGIILHKMADNFRPKRRCLSADTPMESGSKTTFLENFPDYSLSGLDVLICEENKEFEALLRHYFTEDPEQVLSQCCLTHSPQCNAKVLVQRRLLNNPPDKWKDICTDLGVPFGTVSSFWYRKCLPLLQEISVRLR